MNTLKFSGSESPYFEFKCIPLEIEYNNSVKSK